MATKIVILAAILSSARTLPADLDAVYEQVSAYCGVPSDILYAVSLVESGRWREGKNAPWPWTLNIEGKGYYFATREAMFEQVMAAISEKRSVDIGPMQTNWHWKFEQLGSPWKATEPVFNIKTGCQIIRALYEKHGDWWVAVGKYHRESDAPRHQRAAAQYSARVYKEWERLR
ncbi:MAG: hypothetical protein AAF542_21865 [Pseudomonadota bacterium]